MIAILRVAPHALLTKDDEQFFRVSSTREGRLAAHLRVDQGRSPMSSSDRSARSTSSGSFPSRQ
jgi:hypothetical protein